MARKFVASIGKIDIVYSNSDDAGFLHNNLRPQDVRECLIHGVTPYRALHMPLYDKKCKTFTALVDDKAICMFGTMGHDHSRMGSVWLLGSSLIEKNYFSFLKASHEMVELMQNDYEILENVVPADHQKTISWLGWLGFIFHKEPVIVNSYACLRFVRCQDHLEVQMVIT
jgi:hypothetical protein